MCNSLFAFTSLGGKVDRSVNNGTCPYVFRLNGQIYHRIGSLLPIEREKPIFAQLYIYDTNNEIGHRIDAVVKKYKKNEVDPDIVVGLLKILDNCNELVKAFRMARDRFTESEMRNVKIRLIRTHNPNGRQYNLLTSSEVAVVIVGDFNVESFNHDVIVENKLSRLQQISELYSSFMSLQYPLPFPYGEDGFLKNVSYKSNGEGKVRKRGAVTIREYYAFRIQQRANEGQTLMLGGRLFQQFIVDVYTCIKEARLRYIQNHQIDFRIEILSGLMDAVLSGDTDSKTIGKCVILPSSFTGGPRYMAQNYKNAMAICEWAGYPDLFITFTCNPKWPEISLFLDFIPGQNAKDQLDIVARVVKIKLDQLLHDLTHGKHFGRVIASM